MININLVIKPEPRISWRRLATIAGVMVLLAGSAAYGLSWWTEYRQLTAEQAQVAALADTYRQLVQRDANLRASEAAAEQQWTWLEQVRRNQAPHGQSRVLAALFQAAGSEVQLLDITFQQGREVALTGRAPTFAAAARYLDRLRGLPDLSWVRERKVETGDAGETLFTFHAGVGAE